MDESFEEFTPRRARPTSGEGRCCRGVLRWVRKKGGRSGRMAFALCSGLYFWDCVLSEPYVWRKDLRTYITLGMEALQYNFNIVKVKNFASV